MGFSRPYYRFNQIEVDDFRPFGWAFVEYQPRPKLQLRMVFNDLFADFQRRLKTWDPDRAAAVLPTVSRRDLYFSPSLYVQVRRSFG